ncbi:MAG: hypothetical protein LUE24_09010 [Lachnospiraceae bacterium]|nr:hypothetical protein [Lachnospiraceae bacterium]
MPDSFILNLSGSGRNPGEEDVLLAARRYDRIWQDSCRNLNELPVPLRLHQEDFAQTLGIAVYDGGSEDMAFSIGGKRNIHAISRKSFEKAAKEVGLGAKMAINRFDAMISGFEKALISAGKELKAQGFAEATHISESILHKGGIARQ